VETCLFFEPAVPRGVATGSRRAHGPSCRSENVDARVIEFPTSVPEIAPFQACLGLPAAVVCVPSVYVFLA
jgi:hypothetical protein